MAVQRIVLANQSRLLREMLRHAIDKNARLHIVGQTTDLAGLLKTIEETTPQWVILSLSPEGNMPQAADIVVERHSTVRVLGMTIDGSQAKVRSSPSQEKRLGSLSLRELIAVLEGDRAGDPPDGK
jgi:DNA-binding NarL/FixJ family response regulator